MKRWQRLLLVCGLALGGVGCSGENYRTLYEMENTMFNELNDYLLTVVDEQTAKEFNDVHGRKIKFKLEDMAKKLEGWEKLYSVDKDAMKVYTELKLCLALSRAGNVKDLRMEDLEGLDDASLIYRLVRDSWANSDRFDQNVDRITAVKAMLRAKNESTGELDRCLQTGPSRLLYFGTKQSQGFGSPLSQLSVDKNSKVVIPQRLARFLTKQGLGGPMPGVGP